MSQRGKHFSYGETKNQIKSDVFSETKQAKIKWTQICEVLEEKTLLEFCVRQIILLTKRE